MVSPLQDSAIRKLVHISFQEIDMDLTFVAKDPGSEPNGSPTLYRTDRQSWVVQGWVVTDLAALAAMDVPAGETVVEIPDRLVPYFQQQP